MGQNDVLAPWRRDILVRGTTAAIFVLLLGLMGFRLAKQIARRQEVEADLARMAATDALTGLCNRGAFDQALEKEWKRAAREGLPLSLVLIDVDHFKLFNDGYGHQAGDAALQAVAAACRTAAQRPADVAARYGGEELALILPNTNAAGAAVVAEATRSAVEALDLKHEENGSARVVTISLGAATLYPPRNNPHFEAAALIRVADRALYEAKTKGRNRVVTAGLLSSALAVSA
jgi:diguanylate cyclase (GGDEF)-like protein